MPKRGRSEGAAWTAPAPSPSANSYRPTANVRMDHTRATTTPMTRTTTPTDTPDDSSVPPSAGAAAAREPPLKRTRRQATKQTAAAAAASEATATPAVAFASTAKQQQPRASPGHHVDSDGDVEMADAPAAAVGAASPPRDRSKGPAANHQPAPGGMSDAPASAAAPAAASSSGAVRCDSNSLSVILSFLNLRDFKSSTRVSRQWKAASSTHIAWPKQSIDSLISSLQSDNYDDPNVRRLRIKPMTRMNDGRRFAHLAHLLQSRSFSQVNDIRFTTRVSGGDFLSDEECQLAQTAMLDLVKFPYLQTLNLCTTHEHLTEIVVAEEPPASRNFQETFCVAMGGRLRALFLSAPDDFNWPTITRLFAAHLHHLANLRVLVVDGDLTGDTLWQLQHLEFYHGRCWRPGTLTQAICTLSVERSLKSVSLSCEDDLLVLTTQQQLQRSTDIIAALTGVGVDTSPPLSFTPTKQPTALTMLTLRGLALSTSDFMCLAKHIPTLEYLEVEWNPTSRVSWNARLVLSQLRHMKIVIRTKAFALDLNAFAHPFLPTSPTLRTFSLTSHSPGHPLLRMSHVWLVQLVTSGFPRLERIRIGDWEPTDRDRGPKANGSTSTCSVVPLAGSTVKRLTRSVTVGAAIAAEAQKEERLAEPFGDLAVHCRLLESIDLVMHPQFTFDGILPTMHRLVHLHTLEVTCHPSTVFPSFPFQLPAELYTTIASHPTFRALRVHISHLPPIDVPSPGRASSPSRSRPACLQTNLWQLESGVVPPMRDILSRLPEEASHHEAQRRLTRFRLYRHEADGRVKAYALQPSKSERLGWVWMKQHSE